MFMAIVQFPPIKAGRDRDFQEWFAWSNEALSKLEGFIGRRLLKPADGGNYVAIIEFANAEAFMAMRANPLHDEAGRKVEPLLEGYPTPRLFEILIR